jgi:winged helix-turn-helix protein
MATLTDRPLVDEGKLQALVGKAVSDLGATLSTAMISLGDRLGLFQALASGGAATPAELAARTGTIERYVREWLAACAAGGYLEYDSESARFSLSPEQQIALVDETSPFCVVGGFESIIAAMRSEPMIAERFRTGEGYAYGEHDARLFEGTERFFGPVTPRSSGRHGSQRSTASSPNCAPAGAWPMSAAGTVFRRS